MFILRHFDVVMTSPSRHFQTEDEQRIMGLQEGILSCQLSNHPDKHYNATHCYSPKGRCYRRLDHRHGQGGKY